MKAPMKSPAALLGPGRALTFANVAEGAEGLVVADLARAVAAKPKPSAVSLAVVCRDMPTLAAAYDRAFSFWYSQSPVLHPVSYELRYEELANDFHTEVRKLSAFLQLPWHDAMLAPGEHARAKGFINTPSYAQVTLPVSNRSVGRWQHYRQHFMEVAGVLQPWIERWGYSFD